MGNQWETIGFPVQMSTFVQLKTWEDCVRWVFQGWQAARKMLPNLTAALRIANMAACREGQASNHSIPKEGFPSQREHITVILFLRRAFKGPNV